MTQEQAVEIAKAKFEARNRAFWSFWMNGGQEPKDADYGYHHGWFQVDQYRIGAHDYAPGPTYNGD